MLAKREEAREVADKFGLSAIDYEKLLMLVKNDLCSEGNLDSYNFGNLEIVLSRLILLPCQGEILPLWSAIGTLTMLKGACT